MSLASSDWMGVDQKVFIQGGGVYIINSVPNGTSASLKNPGYAGNVMAGSTITSGAGVYQMGSRYSTGVADPDNALTPVVNLGMAPAKGLPNSGIVISSSSGTVTGIFYGIQPITDCVINTITFAPGYEGDSLVAGAALLDGVVYNVGFTSISLTSGTATIWRGV